jgi:predicted RNase H-like HicB family nuclease
MNDVGPSRQQRLQERIASNPGESKCYHSDMNKVQVTAIIEREGDGYVALCPELDVASQGSTVDEARQNLTEALELFFEAADPSEVKRRMHDEVFVTRLEVAVG